MIPNEPTSTATALHYVWGENCDGWHLVRTPELAIIQERMPPGTSEARHFHHQARQFFFILAGDGVLEVDGRLHPLAARQVMEVAPGIPHQLFNRGTTDLHFLVISQPPSHGDRVLSDPRPG